MRKLSFQSVSCSLFQNATINIPFFIIGKNTLFWLKRLGSQLCNSLVNLVSRRRVFFFGPRFNTRLIVRVNLFILVSEKKKLVVKQQDIIKQILPKYREMEEKGIIEISTSPYYHPILPLLCDSDSAKTAMPGIELPQKRFICPEDAAEQIKRGIKLHEQTFGRKPNGMWPSEGSVSEAIVPIIANQGVNWIATDEEILANSLKTAIKRDSIGHCLDPEILYKPYLAAEDGKRLSIIFRDHILSDLIGFVYTTWDVEKAAEDFIGRLVKYRPYG